MLVTRFRVANLESPQNFEDKNSLEYLSLKQAVSTILVMIYYYKVFTKQLQQHKINNKVEFNSKYFNFGLSIRIYSFHKQSPRSVLKKALYLRCLFLNKIASCSPVTFAKSLVQVILQTHRNDYFCIACIYFSYI